ncbi:glycosyltransferase family 2 protein [Sulfurimonas sp.]|uniref:glycosyltransferase family 2 protein n=1 Tax=Sulfurimonas sp. TaxID=2022749 RepID=UPI003D1437FC
MKISVVIPFYNTPMKFFKECVDSVKKLSPFEIILVDDCSTDVEIITFAKQSGCKYIKTAYQSGHDGHPFNVGVENAKGEYICRVDSDDVLLELPQKMPYDIHFGNADRVKVSNTFSIEEFILAPRAIFNAMVLKRELMLQYKTAEDANVFSDVLLILRLLYNNHNYSVHEKVNYIYNKRENSIQTSKTDFQHRLRQVQTVARFCYLENIDPEKSIEYLQLVMLHVRFGSDSRKFLKAHMLQKQKRDE